MIISNHPVLRKSWRNFLRHSLSRINFNKRKAKNKYTKEFDGLILKNNLNSLKENNTFMLHSYSLKFDFEEKEEKEKEETESSSNILRNEIKARLSLQARTFLEMIGVKEKDIYSDADS